jgi:hypothetical protein
MFEGGGRGRPSIEPFISLITDLDFGIQITKLLQASRGKRVVERFSLPVTRGLVSCDRGKFLFRC